MGIVFLMDISIVVLIMFLCINRIERVFKVLHDKGIVVPKIVVSKIVYMWK